MNSNAQNAAFGAVVVVLGYALVKHFKPAAKGAPASLLNFKEPSPINPDPGYGYDPVNPSEYIPLKSLINGTITDELTGQTAGDAIPTTSELFTSATARSGRRNRFASSLVVISCA